MPDPVVNGTSVPSITPTASENSNWASDVQRLIALILIGTFAILSIIVTVRMVIVSDAAAINDMSKTLQAAMVNMALIALGFFFGSNMSKTLADAGQQRIVEKLTSSAPPSTGPVAPVVAPLAVVPWWSILTDAEKSAITAAAAADLKVMAFVTTSTAGKASLDDLNYLVSAKLLTQDRADAIVKV